MFPIRLDNIISFFGFAAGGLLGIYVMKRDILTVSLNLGFLAKKVDDQGTRITDLTKAVTDQRVFEERFINIQREITDLKHGRGFVDLKAALRALGDREGD